MKQRKLEFNGKNDKAEILTDNHVNELVLFLMNLKINRRFIRIHKSLLRTYYR